MNNTISLHEAAEMLSKANPKIGNYEWFKKRLIKGIIEGELTIVGMSEKLERELLEAGATIEEGFY